MNTNIYWDTSETLIFYLVRFNTNIKLHFLTYIIPPMSNLTFPSFNLSKFIEEDATIINNEDRKGF